MKARFAPRLIAVTDRGTADAPATLERFAMLGRAARPGSVVFQLRDLELPARERLAFGAALLAVARACEQLFMVNDRIDFAVLLGADGVHLGEAGVASSDARRLLGESSFVSRACHDPDLVGALDADAVLLSPIWEGRKARPPLGMRALSRARSALARRDERPWLFALGGISSDSVRACLTAGADGVAAIGAILDGSGLALVRALGIER